MGVKVKKVSKKPINNDEGKPVNQQSITEKVSKAIASGEIDNSRLVVDEEDKESVVEKDQIEEMETSPADDMQEDEEDIELQRIKDDEEEENQIPVPDIGEKMADVLEQEIGPLQEPLPINNVNKEEKENERPLPAPLILEKEKVPNTHVKTPDEVDELPEHEVVAHDINITEDHHNDQSPGFEEKIALDENEKETKDVSIKSEASIEAVRDNEIVEVAVEQKVLLKDEPSPVESEKEELCIEKEELESNEKDFKNKVEIHSDKEDDVEVIPDETDKHMSDNKKETQEELCFDEKAEEEKLDNSPKLEVEDNNKSENPTDILSREEFKADSIKSPIKDDYVNEAQILETSITDTTTAKTEMAAPNLSDDNVHGETPIIEKDTLMEKETCQDMVKDNDAANLPQKETDNIRNESNDSKLIEADLLKEDDVVNTSQNKDFGPQLEEKDHIDSKNKSKEESNEDTKIIDTVKELKDTKVEAVNDGCEKMEKSSNNINELDSNSFNETEAKLDKIENEVADIAEEIKDIQDNLETTSQKDASEKLLLNKGDTETETKEETQDLNDDIITTSQTEIKDTLMEKETKDTVIEKEIKDTVIDKETKKTEEETQVVKDDIVTTSQKEIEDTVTMTRIDTVRDSKEETQDLKDDVDTTSQKEINDTVSEKEIDTVTETKEETQISKDDVVITPQKEIKDTVSEKEIDTVTETKEE